MNQLTREEILEKYNKVQIQEECKKYNIEFGVNQTKEQLLDLFFENTFEKRKIYNTEELDKFSVSTVYSLCKRLNLNVGTFKGFVPQYQKTNLIIEYQSYLRTLNIKELEKLSETAYPSNNRFVRVDFLEDLISRDVDTSYVSQIDTYIITETIVQGYRYLKTNTGIIDCIEFLYFAIPEVLDNILVQIGNYPLNKLTYDDKICLIMWHILYEVNYNFCDDPEFSVYLQNASPENLKDRIIGESKYPEDCATLLWILNTRTKPPVTHNHYNLRYSEYLKLSGPEINNLGYAYTPLPTSKYRILALAKEETLLHNYALTLYKPENIDIIKHNLGIVLPPNLKISPIQYIQKNLIYYEKILLRRKESGLPPIGKCSISELQWYTDLELFNYYDLSHIKVFEDRKDLLQRICFYLKTNYMWHLEYTKSANTNLHAIMCEERVAEDDNPIICYGNLIYYKAYNIDELEESFKHYEEDGFRFKVPDGNGYTPDFSVLEIHKLIKFIQLSFPGKFNDFIEKAMQGILFLGNIETRLIKIKDLCVEQEFKDTLIHFCNILFILSMKMKKWEAIGKPYPLEWKEQRNTELLKMRDNNTEIALSDYIQYIDSLSGPLKIKICQIPRISYNFKTAELRIGYETIHGILEQITEGNFCIAHGSDILIQTAYILWIKVLGFDLKGINKQLRKYLKCETQPDFDPANITNTGHIDPTNRLIDF